MALSSCYRQRLFGLNNIHSQKNTYVNTTQMVQDLSVCLLTLRPIRIVILHFRTVGRGFGMYEDTKGTTLFQS